MNKNTLIQYYKNRIFEINFGFWQLNTGIWNTINIYNNNSITYPFKIYHNYTFLPLIFNNIDYYILYINGEQTNFPLNIHNFNKTPNYDILIYFTNSKYPIHYTFKFGDMIKYTHFIKKNNYKFIQNMNDNIMLFNSLLFLLQNSDSNNNNLHLLQFITNKNMTDNISNYNISN
tara:strand:+ start:1045 stop:1566 length:522 start_codon:yes stop_codon:yes gene_type:complete